MPSLEPEAKPLLGGPCCSSAQCHRHVDLAESGSEPSVRTIASASLRSSPRDSLLEPWDTSPVPVEAQAGSSTGAYGRVLFLALLLAGQPEQHETPQRRSERTDYADGG